MVFILRPEVKTSGFVSVFAFLVTGQVCVCVMRHVISLSSIADILKANRLETFDFLQY